MSPTRSREHQPSGQTWLIPVVSLVFLSVLVVFMIAVFFLRPDLTSDQRNLLRLLWALLAGFAAGFMGGAASIRIKLSRPVSLVFSATGGIAVFVFMYLVAPYWLSEQHATAAEVRTCMSQHQLRLAHQLTRSSPPAATPSNETYELVQIESCDWPPPTYAFADGYSEITVASVPGPETYEASGADVADRIHAPCTRLRVVYEIGAQGAYAFETAIVVSSGSVYTSDGRRWLPRPPEVTLPFYPDLNEIVVLHNLKHSLQQATCLS